MNWSENDEAAMPAEAQAPDASQASANTLFMGDSGELALDTRRALVQLLAGPSLDGRRHPKLWPILVRDEAVIRRRLAELFLELVIDRDVQVAFTRQADTGEEEIIEVPENTTLMEATRFYSKNKYVYYARVSPPKKYGYQNVLMSTMRE